MVRRGRPGYRKGQDLVSVFAMASDVLHKAFNWEDWLESATAEWMKHNPDSFVSAIDKMDQRWLYRLERMSSYDILEYEIRNEKGGTRGFDKPQREAVLRLLAGQRGLELGNLGGKMSRSENLLAVVPGISLKINIYRDWSEVTLEQIGAV